MVPIVIIGVFGGHKTDNRPWQPDKKLTAWTLFGGAKAIVPKDMPVTLGGVEIVQGP